MNMTDPHKALREADEDYRRDLAFLIAYANPHPIRQFVIENLITRGWLSDEEDCTKQCQLTDEGRRRVAAALAAPPAAPAVGDEFRGSTERLVSCIHSLLRLDATGSLVPHGIGGHARTLLAAAASRLTAAPGDGVRVPRDMLDALPEINPSNYTHDDVCALNAWGVELVLAAAPSQAQGAAQGDAS